MKLKHYKLFRGLCVLCAFLCALFIGLSMIAAVPDYKAMINGVLGVKSSFGGNAEDYAFTSEFKNTKELLAKRKEVAEQIGEEGCVLLKNENGALPLGDGEAAHKVTVLGSRAYTYKKGGGLRDSSLMFYAGIVGSPIKEQKVTIEKDGKEEEIQLPVTLEKSFANCNIEINPNMVDFYSEKPFPNPVPGSEANGSSGAPFSIGETPVTLNDCKDYANYNDACFVVIGRSSGEGREYLPGANGIEDKSDGSKSALGLSNDERNLIEVANQISENVIVLLNSAVAMEIDELKDNDKVDAILWIGLPGSYGMNGVARVISGKASPSGRLSDTYATDASASPAAQNFGVSAQNGSGAFTWSNGGNTYNRASNSHYVVLAEDLYTGYYYYETRYADCVEGNGTASSSAGVGYGESGSSTWNYDKEVAYSFGYGLGYETFEQEIVDGSLKADYENKTVSLDVKVKNIGTKAAKEVVELYVQSPYTQYDRTHSVEKSAIQLIAFDKVSLEPQEEKTVTLVCEMKYFASYDKSVSHDNVTGGYILENAPYYFAIGNGAHEALNNVLARRGYEESALYLENGSSLNAKGCAEWTPELEFNADGVNATLLSVTGTGVAVKNRLQDADYNYFVPDTVTYLSRNDWQGTFPVPYAGLQVTSGMYDFLDSKVHKFTSGSSDVEFGVDHSEEEDEEGVPLKNLSVADMKLASYDDERWDYLVSEITFDEAWQFSPYGGTSCEPFISVNAPVVWQIDGPNGNITASTSGGFGGRNPGSGPHAMKKNDANYGYISADMCCEPMTAATFNKELLKEQGKCYGEEMLWSGNTIIWAPGMNLHRTPFNSRNHEYYSEDAYLTNVLGNVFVEGGLEKGAILAAKHFAFNTQESYREGLCQFMEEQSARELELRAFQGLGEDVVYVNSLGNNIGALGLMTSFSRIGVCGVNAHTGLMKEILRQEWGFKGLSSTDMVVTGDFFNPQDSIFNNVTFMATNNPISLLNNFWPDYKNKDKVKSDPVLMTALYENMHYYMYSIANSNALNGYNADTVVSITVYGWEIAIKVVYWVLLVAALALGGVAVALQLVPKFRNKQTAAEGASAGDGAAQQPPPDDAPPADTPQEELQGGEVRLESEAQENTEQGGEE